MEQEKANGNPSEGQKEINEKELDQVTGGGDSMFCPVYLRCNDCGYEFEDIWRREYVCGNCGSNSLQKQNWPWKH